MHNNELPSRFILPMRLASLTNEAIDKALESTSFSEETTEYIHRAGWVALTGNETVGPTRVPANILGSDQIEIDSMGLIGVNREDQDQAYYVSADFFRDGSPYVLEDDEATVLESEFRGQNRYIIFSGPDLPPTAVNKVYLARAHDSHPFSFTAMNLAAAKFGKQVLKQLSDLECDNLIVAITQSVSSANPEEFRQTFGN